jgi:microsomal prostaglandin-E synthase 1
MRFFGNLTFGGAAMRETDMSGDFSNPAFFIYAIACVALAANLLFLWGYSGSVRTRTRIAINPEDSAYFGASVADVDPPEVARVLRAHANAGATIYPFLILGLVFVLAGGGAASAAIIFGTFTVARLGHSIVYLRAKQPWRTCAFVVSALALIALMLDIIWLLIQRLTM